MKVAEPITSLEALREVVAPPSELVTRKEISELDDYCRDFIARSPFVLVASTDGAASVDVSPKGDPPGFVRVLDARTLAVPDRPGNHRADTFTNVLEHPYVGLIFLIPGSRTTLRVRGRATIARDDDLRASMAVNGRTPALALVVDVATAYFHCAKCIIRSHLWSASAVDGPGEERPDASLLAETMVAHGALPISAAEMQQIIDDDETERLY